MALKRIPYRGVLLNQRTIDMLEAAEAIYGHRFVLSQGSYHPGNPNSAGTHDGGGAVDIDVNSLDTLSRGAIRNATRQVGFASWVRSPAEGPWTKWHVHGIAIGDEELAPAAAHQVVAYHAGRNGLANGGKDSGPDTWRTMTWEKYQQEEELTMTQIQLITDELKRQGDATRQEVRRQAIWMLRYGVQIADDLESAATKYDAARAAGKTEAEAEAIYSASMSAVTADLEKRARTNG